MLHIYRYLLRTLFLHAVLCLSQVLALVSYPVLLDDPRFPTDAKARAKDILSGCRGGSVGKLSLYHCYRRVCDVCYPLAPIGGQTAISEACDLILLVVYCILQ
jgi:hypothetical protein